MPTTESTKKGRRVTIDLTPAATREVDRLRRITGATTADLFRNAMTLLRIYIQAEIEGKDLRVLDPKHGQVQTRLVLPLHIELEEAERDATGSGTTAKSATTR